MSWRDQQLHALVADSASAQAKGDNASAQIELQKASLLGIYSKIPAEGWVDFYSKLGRYDLVATQLQAWPLQVDNGRVAETLTRAQAYDRALPFVQSALSHEPSPQLHHLEAIVQFNRRAVVPGCEASGKVLKAQLSSADGAQLAQACQLLQRGIASREEAYWLIERGIVTPAEQYLRDQAEKTPGDWSLLGNLAMSRGQFDQAQTDIIAGLKLDPTNSTLQAQIVRCEMARKNQDLVSKHQNLLDLLNFKY